MDRRAVLDRLTAGLGLAVLAVAFRPWWSVRSRSAKWEHGHETNVVFTTYGRTPWQVSTRWSVAVLLVAAVAVVWLVFLLRRRRIPLAVRIVALGVAVIATGLTVAQWRGVEPWPPPNSVLRTEVVFGPVNARPDPEQETLDSWAQRDHLRSIHGVGLTADVAEGMWVGVAAMSLTAVALLGGLLPRAPRDEL